MSTALVSRLRDYFEEKTNDGLRSIARYDQDGFEVDYIRDDVEELYHEEELADAIDESRFETFYAPIYERVFAEDHGELTCMVTCFENVLEMNFVIADGVGVAVGLDMEALTESSGIVGEARRILVEERANKSDKIF